MRYFCYDELQADENGEEQSIVKVYSEEEVIANYWDTWYNAMCKKFGKEIVDKEYVKEDCIQDWIVIHWAWESEHNG
jgi:hypothetical protein